MVSRKNIKYKLQQEAKRVPHYGIRKLSIGVASVLLGTVFYMQNGSTVHADVNSIVSAGNNSAKVISENSGTGSLAGAASTSAGVSSANSASSGVPAGDAANLTFARSVSVSPVEKTTSRVSHEVAVFNEPGSETLVGQVNSGISSIPVQNHPVSVSMENTGNGRWFSNLKVNPSVLAVSKVASTGTSDNTVNGGFDQSTWGTLDVSKWTGQENNGVYELTGYTGDLDHIIVPNSADFAKAGRNVGQVGISADMTHSWFENGNPKSIAFSKTDDQMVKAVGSDWTSAFTGVCDRNGFGSNYAHALTLFGGNNLDVSNVTNMNSIFAANKLIALSGVSNWKTDNVTNMSSMFYSNQISDLAPLANWKTDNVTNMSSMFGSNQISDLAPLANWKTDNVTNISSMFAFDQISDLAPLSNWKTDNVTDMSSMFYSNQISDLAPLANWKTDNVTDMSSMFGSNQISDLAPLSNWKTDNVTDMSDMFAYDQISDLAPLSNWKTDRVTSMCNMFAYNQISDLSPLANWKTDNVMNMSYMFDSNQISDLSPLANWKTGNVMNMGSMFNSNQISDLAPLANWKTDNVTDMSFMFDYDQISDLAPLSNWKTDNVTDMSYMFNSNQILYADFTKWDFGKVQNLSQFIDQSNPAIIIVKSSDQALLSDGSVIITKQNQLQFGSDTVDMPTVYVASDKVDARQKILADIKTKLANYQKSHANDDIKPVEPLDQLTNLVDLANAKFTVKHPLPELDTNDAFALDPANGLHEHKNVNDNGGYDTDFWGTLDVSKFTTVKNGDNLEITGYTGDAAKVIIPNIADFWANGLDQGAKQVTISSDVMHDLAEKATRIGLSKTNNQKVVASDANWSDVFGGQTNNPRTGNNAEGGMWLYNPNLTVMDLRNLDTTNITDMDAMFNGGRNLNVVGDLSQWNVANVASMKIMFQRASSLTNIGNLDNWNTSKVTDMSSMFGNATNLTNIGDLSKWDTGNVINMGNMFANATDLTNIGNLDNWDTSKVTDMSWMFGTDSTSDKQSHLTNIGDLSNWDTSNVTNMHSMFSNATNLTNIGDLSNWNTSKVTDMSWMFDDTANLTNIGNLSKWQTDNVTNMSCMFSDAINLTNIGDLSKWNTSKVTDMRWMFSGTTNLTNIGNLDNWNTSKVTDMNHMFCSATHLTNIGDLSKWQTGNVTNMHEMFMSANALRHLNISNWDLTRLANKDSMKYMFANDTNLTVIANDLALPVWYQNEINDADYFWNNYMAVITNVPELIRAAGDIDNLKIDDQNASRSIFYDSKGSTDAVAVLKQVNQAYIQQYQNEHPGYTLNLAADVDQTDPIALANARFVSVPREVQFTIAYYDLTGKLVNSTTSTHKVDETVAISPVAPANYVLADGQLSMNYLMRWGLNEVDFLVEPKVTTTTQTKTVSRTIKVQTPDGQVNNVVQTVTFVRNGYLNQVTKQTTYSPWSFGGQYQFSGYQPKPIDGYTADVAPAVSVTPDSSDMMLNLTYHKILAVYSVDYQLANGTVVKNVSVTPGSNGRIQLTAPVGYRLLTPVTDMQVGHGSQKLAVFVVPDEQTYTTKDALPSAVTEPLTKTVIRKVVITMPNGRTRTVTQTVRFERTATVKADGTVVYSNWQAIGRTQFIKVFVAKRHGYHLVITDASGKVLADVTKVNNVTAEMNDEVVSVKYIKD